MLDFKLQKDPLTGEERIETSLAGKLLLTNPQLNKGTAFSEQERHDFGLLGKLPAQIETIEEQAKRAYLQFQNYSSPLQKNIYLNNLHDKNQVLFYKLVSMHIDEVLPLIYTPIVGNAVKQYSREFRQARGLYIAYPYRDYIEEILDNRSHPEIDLIVVTDGEGVLGIGDQGIGAIDIPIAKLMVYTLCAGINPLRTLPIMLDVGTNNEELLNDPLYLGLRHPRIRGKEYDDFVAQFVAAVQKKFPHVFLHWEDFGRDNARHNLDLYRNTTCTFNDDIQGTGVVTVAALLAASKVTHTHLTDQRIVIYGAGTAGTGIADQIYRALRYAGLTEQEARAHFWLIDKPGLLTTNCTELTTAQLPYARDAKEIAAWQVQDKNNISLLETINHIKPTVLIGSSARPNAFGEDIIRAMAKHVTQPLILPLSNPPEKAEAQPADVIAWTDGKALIATGSPFPTISINDRTVRVAQCNNALSFPGIGLGVMAVKAKHVTDDMLWAASQALSECAPILRDIHAPLLPLPFEARDTARKIAIAVAEKACEQGLAQIGDTKNIPKLIDSLIWDPHYVALKRKNT
jgi:malate dehydrogenase (oxaloacetate-decarboxylating)